MHGVGVLLVTAIGGYWVLERAEKHRRPLKTVGQLLGGSIILISLLGVACSVWCAGGRASCGWNGHGGKAQCPFSARHRAMAPADSVPPAEEPPSNVER